MHFYVLISPKWVYFTANMSRKIIYIITTILIMGTVSSVQAQFRKYSNEFLNIGPGARGLAMGGAVIATVDDATSGIWNPAALANIQDSRSLTLMHGDYFSGVCKYEFGSIAIPTSNKNKTIGLSLIRFGVDDIPNTLYLVNPDGSIDYNNVTSFSSADYAFLFSYAQKVKLKDADLLLGGSSKIIYRKVGSFATAWGFGFDAGAQLKKGDWRFGAILKDVTTTFNAWNFNFSDREKQVLYLTNNDIPVKSLELTAPHLTVGAGYNFKLSKKLSLLAETDWALNFDGKRNSIVSSNFLNIDPSIGLEADYNKVIYVRAGVGNFQQALSDGDTTNQKKVWICQPSVGVGVTIGSVTIDYSLSNLANQSNPLYSNIFSLKIKLIDSNKKKTTTKKPIQNTKKRRLAF